MSDMTGALWRKSSHSGNEGACVEVAVNLADVVAVRDSKDITGPTLAFTHQQWRTFTQAVQGDALHPAP